MIKTSHIVDDLYPRIKIWLISITYLSLAHIFFEKEIIMKSAEFRDKPDSRMDQIDLATVTSK